MEGQDTGCARNWLGKIHFRADQHTQIGTKDQIWPEHPSHLPSPQHEEDGLPPRQQPDHRMMEEEAAAAPLAMAATSQTDAPL